MRELISATVEIPAAMSSTVAKYMLSISAEAFGSEEA
jgi:hypothetical protein